MRALVGRVVLGLFGVLAFGACGDSLELGSRGSGQGSGGTLSLEPCPTTTDGTAPSCSACGANGDSCGAPDNVTCCCGPATDRDTPAWQCFSNAGCCPAQPPERGAPCDCIDFLCRYCSDIGTNGFICGPDGTWEPSNAINGC